MPDSSRWYRRTLSAAERTDLVADGTRNAGLEHSEEMVEYLWDLHISALAVDNVAVEVWPPDRSAAAHPYGFLHQILIGELGMALGELWRLGDLAASCAADGVYECAVISAPMRGRLGRHRLSRQRAGGQVRSSAVHSHRRRHMTSERIHDRRMRRDRQHLPGVPDPRGRDVTGIDRGRSASTASRPRGWRSKASTNRSLCAPGPSSSTRCPRTETFDVVILSVKGYDNRWAALYARDILKPDGVLLSAQNGLHEVALPDVVGENSVVGCVVAMGAEVLGPAAVKCSTGTERPHLFIGELTGAESPRVTDLAGLLEPAGPVEATTGIWAELWSKMTQNVMFNGLAGICGFTAGTLWTDPRCTDIALALAHECALVAHAQGSSVHPILGRISSQLLIAAERPETEAWTEATRLLCAEGRKRTGKRDNTRLVAAPGPVEERRTEVDYFNGVLADLGARLGVRAPVSTLITRTVHQLERRNLETGPELLDEVHKLVLETIGAA